MGDFLKKYVEYSEKLTDAPTNFHQWSAIFTAGIIINRTRFIQFGSSKIFPNFWAIFLAKSSFSRKTTVLRIGEGFIKHINPLLLYSCEFSHEKLIELLGERPKGVFYYSEFKTLMGLLSKDYMMGTKAFLTEIFDCGDYSRQTKKESINIEKSCISLLSATTSDWFNNSIKDKDLEGGFLGRFLYINAEKKKRNDGFPPKPDLDLRISINNELNKIIRDTREQCGEMELEPLAKQVYLEWYNKFCEKMESIPNNIQPLFSRLNIYCLKIAIVLETCENCGLVITEETMVLTIEIIDKLIKNTLELCEFDISFTPHEANEKKILKHLRNNPSQESVRSRLLRYTHLSAFEFNNAINTLLEKEQIIKKTVKLSNKLTEIISLSKE